MITIPSPELIDLFKTTPGAISLHEAIAIVWLASQAPQNGVCFDLGTNAGKAAICQSIGLSQQGHARDLFCVDTVFDLTNDDAWKDNKMQPNRHATGWSWIHEPDFHDKVRARINKASGDLVTPHLIGDSVLKAIPERGKPGIAFAFCDADNGNKALTDGIVEQLVPKMVAGGIIAHHDYWGQMIFPHEAQDRVLEQGGFERIEIPWNEIKTIVDELGGDHGTNLSWHHRETERPMFVGAIRRV